MHTTLVSTLWQSQSHRQVRNLALVFLGSLLLTASAKLAIPFYPVPMTMQSLMVLMIGIVYGWRLGTATILLYLLEGAMGLPVFAGTPAKGIGLAYMLGPTGGYLLGFVLAAMLTGFLTEKFAWDRRPLTSAWVMLLGLCVIYLSGLAWLGHVIGWDKPILALGLTPFLLGDILKIALGAVLLPNLWKYAQHKCQKNSIQ